MPFLMSQEISSLCCRVALDSVGRQWESQDRRGGASGAYSAREEQLKREEEVERFKFVCLLNDGVDQHMVWLVGLKNIFTRQLPNLPKEYIVRQVMDSSRR